MLSTELELALAPGRTYRRLLDEPRSGVTGPLGPIAFSALVTGMTVAFASSRWASVELVATTAVSWSFPLALQAVAAAAIILTDSRRVGLGRAFELFFRGHGPWTLWMLGVGAMAIVGRGGFQIESVVFSGIIPSVWTGILVAAFAREVLGATRGGAVVRAVAHQLLIWTFVLAYISWAAGGWMRVVQAVTS